MNNSVEILSIIQNKYPDLQDEFLNYVESILMENADTFETATEIQDSIEGILNEIDASKSDEVYDLCCQIFELLVQKSDNNRKPILLNNPICIGDLVEKNKLPVAEVVKEKLMNGNTMMSDEAIKKNLVEVEEKMNKKMKKKPGNEMPTLLISQQFSKNITLYDKDDNNEENGTSLTNFVISNFDMSFGSKMLLKDSSISISIGRRYGLIGRNGLGKTTLLKAISTKELKMPSNVSILLVEQEVIGDETKAIDSVLEADVVRTRLLKELDDINANNKNSSKNSTNLAEIYQKLDLIEADKAPARACNILKGLGFSADMQIMSTREFSGGWRMRISLARALFSQPDLLLLDEPTNMLDMKAVIWLENYLKTWRKSLIIVSHDQKFLDAVATDILFLHSQKIEHYKCNYSQFEESRQIKLTNQMKEYESQMQYREHVQVFIDRFRTYTSKAAMVQSRIKMLEKLPKLEPVEKEVKVVFEFPSCPKLPSPVLQADDLCFGYNSDRVVINKLVISVGSHSRICIVGENGAGKSTLLKLFMNELEPQSGMLRCHKNLRIGFFSQHHVDQLVMTQSSLEFLQTKFPGFEPEYYRGRLGSFGIIGDVSLRPIYSLSGGQKSRVAFTILSMRNPNFLILDEPTNHLDMQTISALGDAIRKFEGGVVLVSHDERLINNVCEELWLVEKNGTVSIVDGGISKYREMVQKEF